jgi:hypothetical protein
MERRPFTGGSAIDNSNLPEDAIVGGTPRPVAKPAPQKSTLELMLPTVQKPAPKTALLRGTIIGK